MSARNYDKNQNTFEILYRIQCDDDSTYEFPVVLNTRTLERIHDVPETPPDWARIGLWEPGVCELDPNRHQYCPLALAVSGMVEQFRELLSYTEVTATVETPQRIMVKRTTVQRALSSLIGLLMATSGCPSMAFLKPLARFHMPFATREETIFRVVGAYLFGQYLLHHRGLPHDMNLDKLRESYARVHAINISLARQLRDVPGGDANVNAVVLLDLFAQEFPPAIDEHMAEMAYLFADYVDEAESPLTP